MESAGAVPYGVGIIEPVRVEVGMIVTGYDYEEHERTPYDLGMDRVVALDAEGEFMGKETLREIAQDPPNRFKTIRLEGEALPAYGAAVTPRGRGGRRADEPRRPAQLGPDRPRDPACGRRRPTATRVEVAARRGPIAGGTVDVAGPVRPEEGTAARLTAHGGRSQDRAERRHGR